MVRYRTESFSGLGNRDIVEVLQFETFELGNTDILETLRDGVLKGNAICDSFSPVIDFLDGESEDEPYPSLNEQAEFFKGIVNEISRVTGINVKYALWLADMDAVTDKTFYGKYLESEEDVNSYEVGPVILSEIGYDGTLYGYETLPCCLEEQIEILRDELTDVINERENDRLSKKRAEYLDNRYVEVDNRIHEIQEHLQKKQEAFSSVFKPSLEVQIESASERGAQARSTSHVITKAPVSERCL